MTVKNTKKTIQSDLHPVPELQPIKRPSREEALEAVKTLILWAGDDPSREGLLDTPSRVIDSYGEFFSGYSGNPNEELQTTFADIENYEGLVLLRDISFSSHCEHHILPIVGKAHVAYYPSGQVVGISKIARVIDIFSKRLQTQERLTSQIANQIQETLGAKGVAVMLEATHHCMSIRGVNRPKSKTLTCDYTGCFKENSDQRQKFEILVK